MDKHELIGKILKIIREELGDINTKEDAALLGYITDRLLTLEINEDGTLSYCGYFIIKNGKQWDAIRYIDLGIKKYVEGLNK